jgi:WD40 repeat protein
MTGERLMQVPSTDGRKLFTLYTSQPEEYAEGYDRWQSESGRRVAFVHTLSLEDGWAVCVPLPGAFGTGDARDEALATSSDGLLYVVDTGKRLIAVMDPSKLKIVRTARVDFGSSSSGQTHAALSPDGRRLFVATGDRIALVDTASLERQRTWKLEGAIDGIGFSSDGDPLYVVQSGRVVAIDPQTGKELRTLSSPGATGLEFVEDVRPDRAADQTPAAA